MKKPSTVLKELRKELHHWQGQYRMDLKSLERTRAKCKTIGTLMREVQREGRKK